MGSRSDNDAIAPNGESRGHWRIPPTPEEIIAALVRGIDEMRQDCHRILRMSLSEEAVNAIME